MMIQSLNEMTEDVIATEQKRDNVDGENVSILLPLILL